MRSVGRPRIGVVVGLLLLSGAVHASDVGRCGVCHSDIRVQFDAGIHKSEGFACVNCHGGNPASDDMKIAHGGSFKGVPGRREIPPLCASCHSNIELMKPYNLATDQYALYQSSQHGRLLAQGNPDVAVCTDCHGTHEIRPRSDPQSSVNITNIPKTCGRCHSDAKIIAKYKLPSDPSAEYYGSVHAAALYKAGNLNSPDCSRCHGVHGAAPPGVGDVSKVCGQCHATARRYFDMSPHKEALAAGGNPECASCHSNHAIAPADDKVLETTCHSCHEPGSTALGVATQIEAEIARARVGVREAEKLVEEAEEVPLEVDDYRSRLEDARTYLTEALPVVHSFSVKEVRDVTGRATSISEEVSVEVQEKIDRLRWRRYGLIIFWFYILVTIALLVRWRYGLEKSAPGAGA
ncbi:MAG: cytochrome c3 family protein [Acidobacteria bacterium]|nr:cytochrome c3 family protein [Acidobacteriota bacterium]